MVGVNIFDLMLRKLRYVDKTLAQRRHRQILQVIETASAFRELINLRNIDQIFNANAIVAIKIVSRFYIIC